MKNKLNQNEFIKCSILKFGTFFDYSLVNYINLNTKIILVCPKHGKFETRPADHLRNKYSCTKCMRENKDNGKFSLEEFITKSKSIHGDEYDYSLVEYINNLTYVKIICKFHGEFEQIPSNHYKYGCLKCSNKYKKSVEEFILLAQEIHKYKYDYSKVIYNGMHKKIEIICRKITHGSFWQTPSNHIHNGGRGCPKCSKRISKNETLWLNSLNIPNDKEHRNVYIKTAKGKYFADGFDPNTKTVYEFNGDFYHGNLDIYNANDINNDTKNTFKELFQKTENKRIDLEENGYNVVSIWESDFLKQNKFDCKIIIQDKYSQFITDDDNLFKSIKNLLSFKQTGVEYTAAYQNGWNGITYLLNKKGFFGTGLLNKVRSFLKEKEIKYEEIDRTENFVSNEIDINKRLENLKLSPREHQNKILEAVIANKKGIVRACTGSGKSVSIAMATAKFNDTTIIYVIGLDLLNQFHKLFSSIFEEEIGYIGNGICNIKRINIASIWTIGKSLKLSDKEIIKDKEDFNKEKEINDLQKKDIINLLQKTKIHFFDEGHIISTNTATNIFKVINPIRIYGFSGTPYRGDNSDLLINSILGDQIIDISASEMIEKGILAQPIIKFIPVPKAKNIGDNYQEIYKNYIVENDVRNNLIISNLEMLLNKKYTPLVLFKQIKHGEILSSILEKKNIKFIMLSGSDSLERRDEVKQMLIDKKIDVILASTIFEIGVDLPILNALINCSGGVSNIRTKQKIGRIIRSYPGKKHAAVIDFYDQVKFLKNHSKIRYEIYSEEKGFKVLDCKEMR